MAAFPTALACCRRYLSSLFSITELRKGVSAHLQGGGALCGGLLQRGGVLQALAQRLCIALECSRLQLRIGMHMLFRSCTSAWPGSAGTANTAHASLPPYRHQGPRVRLARLNDVCLVTHKAQHIRHSFTPEQDAAAFFKWHAAPSPHPRGSPGPPPAAVRRALRPLRTCERPRPLAPGKHGLDGQHSKPADLYKHGGSRHVRGCVNYSAGTVSMPIHLQLNCLVYASLWSCPASAERESCKRQCVLACKPDLISSTSEFFKATRVRARPGAPA